MEKKPLKPTNISTTPFLLCPTGHVIELKVNDHTKVDIELFSYLEYLAEVEEKGLERIAQINKINATRPNWLLFQSFIRQAKLYYFSAIDQDPAISSLNFFYSFENLVKAYCSLHFPEKISGKIQHGVATGQTLADLLTQEISILNGSNVASIFYELTTGKKIKQTAKISAQNLLSYCNDILYEYLRCIPSAQSKSIPAKIALAGESEQKIGLLMAVRSLNVLLKDGDLKKVLETYFCQVDLPLNTAMQIMQISLNDYKSYCFLQSKDEFNILPVQIIAKDFYEKFSPFVSLMPRKFDNLFMINLPIGDISGNKIFMNECLAIFMLMFYISELVRYNPKIIQENISKPQGWLMERFVVNTHQSFLRYMVNLITGEDFIFHI